MEKKGSHIGVVISFIMFITFVLFFYFMLSPALKIESKQNSLEILQKKIIDLSSEDITIISVKNSNPDSCLKMTGFFSDFDFGEKIIVRSNLSVLDFSYFGNDLYIGSDANSFFRVYFSDIFDNSESGTMNDCEEIYEIGLVKTEKIFSEQKIKSLFTNYSNNYELLKNNLGLPISNNFGLDFVYFNGTEISAGQISENFRGNVYSEETSIYYIKNNALTEMGILRIRIW